MPPIRNRSQPRLSIPVNVHQQAVGVQQEPPNVNVLRLRYEAGREKLYGYILMRGGVAFLAQLIVENSFWPASDMLSRVSDKALFANALFRILSGGPLNPKKFLWATYTQWRTVRDTYCRPVWFLFYEIRLTADLRDFSESPAIVHNLLHEVLRRLRGEIIRLKLADPSHPDPEVVERGYHSEEGESFNFDTSSGESSSSSEEEAVA